MERFISPNNLEANILKSMFIFVLVALCFFNVIYFLAMTANPLIQSDAWYFLDINVRKWMNHGFDLRDLFIKRNVVDHAQPLNKLFLYLNFRFFNLDFRFESLIGIAGLFSIALFFLYQFLKHLLVKSVSAFQVSAFSFAILILTSLNATGLYTWSLVTFSFFPLAIAFGCAWLTWQFLQKQNAVLCLIFLLFSLLAIGDTAAIILWVSIFLSVVLTFRIEEMEYRKKSAILLLTSGAFVAAIFLIVNLSFLTAGANNGSIKPSQLQLTNPYFYLDSIRIIFSSSIIHGSHLTALGGFGNTAAWIIAIPIFYFYIKHFFDLIFRKRKTDKIEFLVTFILIYASISIAAIIFGRVSEFGVSYLNQPRYLVIYQLIPFSLFIKWAFSENNSHEKQPFHLSATISLLTVFIIYIQFFVSQAAYRSVPWVWKWHIEQTNAISKYIEDPDTPTGNCTPHSVPICKLSAEKRSELLRLLQEGNLNIFNTNFQNKYRLFIKEKGAEE